MDANAGHGSAGENRRRTHLSRGSTPGADPPTRTSPDPQLGVHTLLDDDVLLGDDAQLAAGRKQGHGDPGRVPVAVLAPAPPWRPPSRRGAARRRPVVALLDTGVDAHPWLAGSPADPVVLDARERGWSPPANSADSGPYQGHATFIAGVIRQIGPDCRVLSVTVMGDDGVVHGSESLRALSWLAGEAESGEPERYADVLCLAYGYQPGPEDVAHNAQLRDALRRLAQAGVLVVASAGNDGDDIPTYPAAFAADPSPPPAPVISVGATNPDGTYAHYSNYGAWVTHKAVGSGVISTMPSFDGDRVSPVQAAYPDSMGVTIDPDNFRGGFARWSGTSFAAATIAGRLAQELLDGSASQAVDAHRPKDSGPPAPGDKRIRRAMAAISSHRI
jgi:serine protease